MNQVSKIIIIIIRIRIRIKKNSKVERRGREERVRERESDFYFLFFLLFASFSDLWKSNRGILLEQEANLVYATRATHG